MSTNSSERTVTTTTAAALITTNPLSSAHHFVSIKLTAQNFLFWRTQLVPFLRGQGLLGYVDGEHLCPLAVITAAAPSDESASAGVTPSVTANPAHGAGIQQDQSILSLLISSLSDEVMYLAVDRTTSREVWQSITAALGSSTRARCLNLLAQFQSLRQGDSSPAEYLGRAQLIVEDLSLADRLISLDEQNLYVFRGLRPEYRAMAASLAVSSEPVTIPQLADFLQAQQFIFADDFTAGGSAFPRDAPTAMVAGRGRRNAGDGSNSCGRGGSDRRNNRGRGGNNRGRGGSPQCQICRSHGHTAIYCFPRYAGQPAANVAVAELSLPSPGFLILHRHTRF
ncbi:PREDICTED: uncharacterized protein LOC109150804 [Ipomoea nil]|uniref:uncharacterized protein LOC109150804 n=1 Tax=Ipomoea nil TaxID=35883 RepID=UPI000901DC26|nr:PREDICTED: uncharacterized protein LOC109150804 [Ipomoea nil]